MFRKYLFYLLFIILSFPLTARDDVKHILIMNSYHRDLTWVKNLSEGIQEGRSLYESKVELYFENMDFMRLKDSMDNEEWSAYLANKYRNIEFDGVIAESTQAALFTYEDPFFRDIYPRVIYTTSYLEPQPGIELLEAGYEVSISQTLDMALAQNPHTRQAVLLYQDSPNFQKVKKGLESLMEERGIPLTVLEFHNMEDIKEQLKKQKTDSIAFYTPFFWDEEGNTLIPRDAVGELAEISPIPIYSFWNSIIGTGCAGGIMIDGKTSGAEMFRALTDYIDKGAFGDDYRTTSCFMDWQIMKKFRLRVSRRNNSITFVNKPVPFYITYIREILILVALILLLFLLLARLNIKKLNSFQRKLRLAFEKTERALMETSAIFMHSNVGIVFMGKNHILSRVNPKFCELFGFSSPKDAVGKTIDILPLVHDQQTVFEAIGIETLLTEGLVSREITAAMLKGDKRCFKVTGKTIDKKIPPDPNKGIVWIIDDITLQKEIELQTREEVKQKTISQIAGGIAHDFNNKLTMIMGYADLCLQEKPDDPHLIEALDIILKASADSASLTEQLMALTNHDLKKKTCFCLSELIKNMYEELATEDEKKYTLQGELSDEDYYITGNREQLHMAIMNIARNGWEAMTEGGVLTMRSQREDRDGQSWYVLEISDTGKGISRELQERIFDPFFSTKQEEGKKGMGLSSARGIIHSLGGTVTVKSEEGKGSLFRIRLPLETPLR
ncbi:MAG: ATP-binding protein [Spirochaetales bacterium]|nr:ATP-binding protein [Spirochaetales bacterium]